MLSSNDLKLLIHCSCLTKLEQLAVCLAVDNVQPKQVKTIRDLAVRAGLRPAKKWNISSILRSDTGYAISVAGGWELTAAGRHRVAELAKNHLPSTVAKAVATGLRQHLTALNSSQTQAFLTETVECYEARHYRAAAVLAWVGAVAILYDAVLATHLPAFNHHATTRFPKFKPASNVDDLSDLKEFNFLQVLQDAGIVDGNVKRELEARLKFRNSCGHPNALRLGEAMVAAHIESLILNVYTKF